MSESGTRRAVAEIRFGEDRSALAKVAGRSIHQFWNVLSPYFRDILLAPQRRSDDGGVSWTWRELADSRSLSATELGNVRKRLEKAAHSFAERPASAIMGDDGPGGINSPELFDQITVRVKAMIAGIVAKTDSDLAGFVCRAETGPMVHSWGVSTPAPLYYPDAMESEIQGVVLVGGNVSAGHEVIVENTKGLVMVRARSDERGAFRFPKIRPGHYRVRVASDRVNFPVKGVVANVERGSVTRLELQSTSNPGDIKKSASDEAENVEDTGSASVSLAESTEFDPAVRGRRKSSTLFVIVGLTVLFALLAGGAAWVFRTRDLGDQKTKAVSSRWENPSVSAGIAPTEKQSGPTYPLGAVGEGAGIHAAVDGPGKNRPINRAMRPEVAPILSRPLSLGRGPGEITQSSSPGNSAGLGGAKSTTNQAESSSMDGMGEVASAAVDSPVGVAGTDFKSVTTSGRDIRTEAAIKQGSARNGPDHDARKANVSATADAQNHNEQESTAAPPATRTAASSALPKMTLKPATRKGTGVAESESIVSIETTMLGETAVSGAVPAGALRTDDALAEQPAIIAPPGRESSTTNAKKNQDSASREGLSPTTVTPDGTSVGDASPASAAPTLPKKFSNAPAHPKRAMHGKEIFDGSNRDKNKNADQLEDNGSIDALPELDANLAAPPPKTDQSRRSISNKNDRVPDTAVAIPPDSAEPDNTVPHVAVKAALGVAVSTKRTVPVAVRSNNSSAGAAIVGEDKILATDDANGLGTSDSSGSSGFNDSVSTNHPASTAPASNFSSDAATEPPSSATAISAAPLEVSPLHRYDFRIVRWRTRLIRDMIVPTQPTRVDQAENVDTVRQKLMEEQRAQLPETFRRPVLHYGVIFKIEPAVAASVLRWVDESSDNAVSATLLGDRAELTWPENILVADKTIRLVQANGTEMARVIFHPGGRQTIEFVAAVRGWYWIGAERSPKDDALSGERQRVRFSWQVPTSGEAKALAWRSDDAWRDGRGCRLEIALDTEVFAHSAVTLVDHHTGWALTGELE